MKIDSLKHDLCLVQQMIELMNELHFIENASELSSVLKKIKKEFIDSINQEQKLIDNLEDII